MRQAITDRLASKLKIPGAYFATLEAALLPSVTKAMLLGDLQNSLQLSGVKPKFFSVVSSEALAVNAFAPWKGYVEQLCLLQSTGFQSLVFGPRLANGLRGKGPSVDLLVMNAQSIIAVESKFLEPFDVKTPHFPPAYGRICDARASTKWFDLMKDIQEGAIEFRYLDAAQLIKSFFGLAHLDDRRSKTLLYLFWEPKDWRQIASCIEHRREIEMFAQAVAKDGLVEFQSLSYLDLFDSWEKKSLDPLMETHVKDLRDRYVFFFQEPKTYDKRKLININSQKEIGVELEEFCQRDLGFLRVSWDAVPIYLVDEALMDRIYPPERRRFLDEECVRGALQEFSGHHEQDREGKQRLWNMLSECSTERSSLFVAAGVYISGRSEQKQQDPLLKNVDPHSPAVFLCPERILDWALKVVAGTRFDSGKAFETVFAKVLRHELAHAYMDKGRDKRASTLPSMAMRMIEESLANAIALSARAIRTIFVEDLVMQQPMEYRGCFHWLELSKVAIREFAYRWGTGEDLGFIDLLHLREAFSDMPGLHYLFDYYLHHDTVPSWEDVAIRLMKEVVFPKRALLG